MILILVISCNFLPHIFLPLGEELFSFQKTRDGMFSSYWRINSPAGHNHVRTDKLARGYLRMIKIHPFFICYFTFFYPYILEKVLFLVQIFETEILMDLHILRSPESEDHIFSGCAMRVSVCACSVILNSKRLIKLHTKKTSYYTLFHFSFNQKKIFALFNIK